MVIWSHSRTIGYCHLKSYLWPQCPCHSSPVSFRRMATPGDERATYDYGPTPCYTFIPHEPAHVLPSRYSVRICLHFVRIKHWKPHEPLLLAPYVPLQSLSWHLGVVPDGNQSGDLSTYKYETMVDTPEYPCRPYCSRLLFTDLILQSEGGLDLADVLRFATTIPWSCPPGISGVTAKIVYTKATEELGAPIDHEQALPDCDQGWRGPAPQVDLEVYFSPEWRLWQPLPLSFSCRVLPMPDEGIDTRRRRNVDRERYCHEVVEASYFGW